MFEINRMQDYFEINSVDLEVSKRRYLSVFLRADNSSFIYKRISYDVLTYLGDLGGLLDAVLMFGFLLTSFFASKLFTAALINKFYRVQYYDKDFGTFQDEPDKPDEPPEKPNQIKFSELSELEEDLSVDGMSNGNDRPTTTTP